MISLHEAVMILIDNDFGKEDAAAVASTIYAKCGYQGSERFECAIRLASKTKTSSGFWDKVVSDALTGAAEVEYHLANRVPIPATPTPFGNTKGIPKAKK